MPELRKKTQQMDEILDHAGMSNKGWTFSGDAILEGVAIGEDDGVVGEKVLGMLWIPGTDTLEFRVVLKLKLKSGEIVYITCPHDLQEVLQEVVLTRSLLLGNIARIFDPLGLLCLIILESKLLMRESFLDKSIGWEDPLPAELSGR